MGIISVGYQMPHFYWTVKFAKVSREMKNCFRGFCMDEKFGNTDFGDTYYWYSFMEVGSVK
jgi:hypothetical protein